jgi:hypothetical protein
LLSDSTSQPTSPKASRKSPRCSSSIFKPERGSSAAPSAAFHAHARQFVTVTVTESRPIIPLRVFALTEIVWLPLATLVESQLKVYGGDEAK